MLRPFHFRRLFRQLVCLAIACLVGISWAAAESWDNAAKTFTIVLDAGHGGHDAGAVGKCSKEKDINLRVVLELGRMLTANCSDVKVIYTRQTDVFIPLQRRADIANSSKADLFVSVHTNALPAGRIAYGSETYTMGMARAASNLEVAKRENAVITYEKDYKTTYAGFDPNKAESYIIFEYMQDSYMKQSVDLASCIQQQYVREGRKNKGVHQAGFLVLRATTMPAVLTELGFISTPEEEAYLNSDEGTKALARSIYNGIQKYRGEKVAALDAPAIVHSDAPAVAGKQSVKPIEVAETQPKPTPAAPKPTTTQPVMPQQPALLGNENPAAYEAKQRAAAQQPPVFKVQLLASDRRLRLDDQHFKGLDDIDYYEENNLYKYTCGASEDYNTIKHLQRKVSEKISGTFIVAFQGGKRIDLKTAISLSKQK